MLGIVLFEFCRVVFAKNTTFDLKLILAYSTLSAPQDVCSNNKKSQNFRLFRQILTF